MEDKNKIIEELLKLINNQTANTSWLEDEEFIPDDYCFKQESYYPVPNEFRHHSTIEKVYSVSYKDEHIGFIIGVCPHRLNNEMSEWYYTGIKYNFAPAEPTIKTINTFKKIESGE